LTRTLTPVTAIHETHRHVITVPDSPELAREVAKQCALHAYGWRYYALISVLAVQTLFFLIMGTRDWIVGALGAALLGCVITPIASYVTITRHVNKVLKSRSAGSANHRLESTEYVVSEDGVRVTAPLGTACLPWTRISRLRRFRHVWLLYTGAHCVAAWPIDSLRTELQDFVVERVRSHGGRLK